MEHFQTRIFGISLWNKRSSKLFSWQSLVLILQLQVLYVFYFTWFAALDNCSFFCLVIILNWIQSLSVTSQPQSAQLFTKPCVWMASFQMLSISFLILIAPCSSAKDINKSDVIKCCLNGKIDEGRKSSGDSFRRCEHHTRTTVDFFFSKTMNF